MTVPEITERLRQMETRLHASEVEAKRHRTMLDGDRLADPPVEGLFNMTDDLIRKVEDKERGNLALHLRVKTMEDTDKKRLGAALGAGAVWTTATGTIILILKWVGVLH